MRNHFEETQRFNQWWLWVLLIGISFLPLIGVYKQIVLQQPFGSSPLSNLGLAIFALVQLGTLLFFRMLRLETEIDPKTIKIRFWPFSSKVVLWSDIAHATVVDYGFVGGWGIRYKTKYGTVYNVRGSMGLAIELKNGTKLCIGTQKPDEMTKLERIR